jgi:RNA polymerase sigma factor (sigma-70 family)
MDSILWSLLDSNGQAERDRVLGEIILNHAVPQVRKVLRLKLGFYLSQSGTNSHHPDAEDIFQEITTKLVQRLNSLLSDPNKNRIENFRQFVTTVATNACHDYLRIKSPERARLKKNLRDLLYRHPSFKIWKNGKSSTLCGFAVWEGRPISHASSEQLKQFRESPGHITKNILGDTNPRRPTPAKIVTEVFKWLDGPIELETLVEMFAELTGTNIQPSIPIEPNDDYWNRQLMDQANRSDRRIETCEKLILIWNEIKLLSPNQRYALSFGMVDEDGENILDLLIRTDIVTFAQLASDLGIPIDKLMDIWKQIPMDSSTIADYLGATRGQVNQWRFRALQNLKKRLATKM